MELWVPSEHPPYSPLGAGGALDNARLRAVAEATGRSAAHALRWLLQRGVAVATQSTKEAHLKEDADVFGWELSKEQVRELDGS